MNEPTVISRHDWTRGLVPCPSCGLPLDPNRDRGEYVQEVNQAQATGVTGRHLRCGAFFTFAFAEISR